MYTHEASLTSVPTISYRTAVYEAWVQNQGTSSVPLLAEAAAKGITEDLSIIYRISQLAGVIIDDRIASLPGAEVQNLRKIALPDRKEAKWARRTLHKLVGLIHSHVHIIRDPKDHVQLA